MRTVAYIGKIIDIQPIKKADFIVSATVVCGQGGRWMGTVKKGDFEIGELVEVYLQDAILPKTEEFAFMEPYKYRVSMRRFKKVPSECLIWKLNWEPTDEREAGKPCVGDPMPWIEKYEKPVPAKLSGQVVGGFPTHIVPKTDEPNFQAVPDMIAYMAGRKFYATEKADGSSGTAYMKANEHFGVCSRNLELKDDGKNAFWQMVKKYEIDIKLPNDYAVQFELVGPGIQGNPLKLPELDIRVFNVYNLRQRQYVDIDEAMELACGDMDLPWAEMIDYDKDFLFGSDEELRKYAEGKYPNGGHREGVVIRPMKEVILNGERVSFKVINLNYKD
jgi:hypothetical protein